MSRPDTLGILSGVPLETTIKVDRDLRDRINAAAREQRMTPARFLAILLDEYLSERWARQAIAEMSAASPDVRAAYRREVESMDGSLTDGLEGEPPYPIDPADVEWFDPREQDEG